MAEFYGPVSTFSAPAQFADRAGRSMQRQMETARAKAEIARQERQRQATQQQKEGQHTMKLPPTTIPAPGWLGGAPTDAMDPERRRYLLQATASGRAALKDEDAHKPAQFAEQPLSENARYLLGATHLGRRSLPPVSGPALFAEAGADDAARLRTLLSPAWQRRLGLAG